MSVRAGAPPRLARRDAARLVRRVADARRRRRRAAASDPALARLEEELQKRSEQLRTTIEQYEASAEELKASNEELQAINEELRSTTEELETSKEELQSTNEELITVNHELKIKIDETAEINDDLSNLISSSDIATVFVDPQMRIKRFTPAAAKIFNLIAADVGRSLFDITHRLDYESARRGRARGVLDAEDDRARGRRWTTGACSPGCCRIAAAENRIGGAVLNFVDVTTPARGRGPQLDVDRERAALVAETMTDFAILTIDPEGKLTSWNPGASNVFGYSEREALGQPLRASSSPRPIAPPASRPTSCARRDSRAAPPDERWMRRKDGVDLLRQRREAPLRAGARARLRQDLPRHDRAAPGRGAARAGPDDGADERGPGGRRERAEERVPRRDVARAEASAQPDQRQRPAADDAAGGEDAAARCMRAARTIQRTVMSQGRIIDDLLDMSRLNTGKLTVNRVPLVLAEAMQPAVDLGARRGERSAAFASSPRASTSR